MSVKVTVASGKYNIVLPDGNRYQAGDTVVLTDDQWAQISQTARTTLFTGTPVAAGVTDASSESDSPSATVDGSGHTVIGDTGAQDESDIPPEDTTYS